MFGSNLKYVKWIGLLKHRRTRPHPPQLPGRQEDQTCRPVRAHSSPAAWIPSSRRHGIVRAR
jgi:hypothetical protein